MLLAQILGVKGLCPDSGLLPPLFHNGSTDMPKINTNIEVDCAS